VEDARLPGQGRLQGRRYVKHFAPQVSMGLWVVSSSEFMAVRERARGLVAPGLSQTGGPPEVVHVHVYPHPHRPQFILLHPNPRSRQAVPSVQLTMPLALASARPYVSPRHLRRNTVTTFCAVLHRQRLYTLRWTRQATHPISASSACSSDTACAPRLRLIIANKSVARSCPGISDVECVRMKFVPCSCVVAAAPSSANVVEMISSLQRLWEACGKRGKLHST
jgi:hypothetical protein